MECSRTGDRRYTTGLILLIVKGVPACLECCGQLRGLCTLNEQSSSLHKSLILQRGGYIANTVSWAGGCSHHWVSFPQCCYEAVWLPSVSQQSCLLPAKRRPLLVSETKRRLRSWEPTMGGVGDRGESSGIKRKGPLRGRWYWGRLLNRRRKR